MKIRFPIVLKFAFLGLLVTSIASGVALTISYINQSRTSEAILINNIDKSLDGLVYNFSPDHDSGESASALANVKKYISEVYENPDVHDKTIDDFDSFEEYEAYFQKAALWIFPPKDAMIGSRAYMEFSQQYRELSHVVQEAHLSSGVRAAYICYKEVINDETRFVFINDSRISNPSPNDKFYHLPCSHYVLRDSDVLIDLPNEEYYGYKLAGYLTRFAPIECEDEDGNKEILAYAFLEYDENDLKQKNLANLFNELWIIAIVVAINVLIYMLLAYLTVIRNLNKLTRVTDNISKDLKDKKPITPSHLVFKTKDEIASLASSFNVMEEEIIKYVDIIKQEAKENERREAELEVASNIQLSALPNRSFIDDNLNLLSYIKPAKVVGGDFYDYFYNKDEFITIIADVSGKGVPASLFMMKAKTLIKSKLLNGLSLVDAAKEANNELVNNNQESLFVTAFIAAFDFQNKKLHYVNAGHEKPYILRNGEVIKLEGPSNFVLGGVEDINFIEEEIDLLEGDMFFTFTDGLNESINKNEEEFGYERIVNTLKQCDKLSPGEIIALFNNKLKDFVKEEEQFDDITMIALQCKNSHLHLSYDKKDYELIEETTNEFLNNYNYLSEETKSHVGIVLDELLNNLISYEKREDLKIDIDFSYQNEELKVVISSNGADYDPFANHKDKKLSKEDVDAELGGFGVKLVKTLSKKQEYSYKNKKSIVTLIF